MSAAKNDDQLSDVELDELTRWAIEDIADLMAHAQRVMKERGDNRVAAVVLGAQIFSMTDWNAESMSLLLGFALVKLEDARAAWMGTKKR